MLRDAGWAQRLEAVFVSAEVCDELSVMKHASIIFLKNHFHYRQSYRFEIYIIIILKIYL